MSLKTSFERLETYLKDMKKPQNTLVNETSSAALADLGQRLQRLRLSRQLQQAEAAIRAGLARSTASRIENGDASVAIGQILRYLEAVAPEKSLTTLFTTVDLPSEMLSVQERRKRARPLNKAALKALDF